MKTVLVVAAIIRRGGKILIAQRKQDSKLEPGKWEFPGGKIEFGEHPQEALVREIREELGIGIRIVKLFSVESHVYRMEGVDRHIILLVFLAEPVSGEVRNLDVQDSRWVSAGELMNFEFVAGDKRIVEELGSKKENG